MYCDRTHLVRIFGKANIDQWADLSNNKDSQEMSDRIDYMIEVAQAMVDAKLEPSAYQTPFSEPPPTIISHATALLAGVRLYDGRRVVTDESPNQTAAQEAEYEDIMSRILADVLHLPLPRLSTKPIKVHSDTETNGSSGAIESAFKAPC